MRRNSWLFFYLVLLFLLLLLFYCCLCYCCCCCFGFGATSSTSSSSSSINCDSSQGNSQRLCYPLADPAHTNTYTYRHRYAQLEFWLWNCCRNGFQAWPRCANVQAGIRFTICPLFSPFQKIFVFVFSILGCVLHRHTHMHTEYTKTYSEQQQLTQNASTHVQPGNGNENSAKNNNNNKNGSKKSKLSCRQRHCSCPVHCSPRRRPCLCVWGTGKAAKITAQQTTLMSNSDNGQRTGREGVGKEKSKGNGQRHRTCRQSQAGRRRLSKLPAQWCQLHQK